MAEHRKASRTNPRNDLTAKHVRSVLRYSKSSGLFVWRPGGHFQGKVAGGLDGRGYIKIYIGSHHYMASRLAWLYVTGRWPKHEVDHKNRNRSDNRWRNLREATVGQNGRNTIVRKDSESGLKGARKHATNDTWIGRIRHDGKMRHLGVFKTAKLAHAAYCAAAKRLAGGFYNPG